MPFLRFCRSPVCARADCQWCLFSGTKIIAIPQIWLYVAPVRDVLPITYLNVEHMVFSCRAFFTPFISWYGSLAQLFRALDCDWAGHLFPPPFRGRVCSDQTDSNSLTERGKRCQRSPKKPNALRYGFNSRCTITVADRSADVLNPRPVHQTLFLPPHTLHLFRVQKNSCLPYRLLRLILRSPSACRRGPHGDGTVICRGSPSMLTH